MFVVSRYASPNQPRANNQNTSGDAEPDLLCDSYDFSHISHELRPGNIGARRSVVCHAVHRALGTGSVAIDPLF